MAKNRLLERQGKVLKFDQFVSEHLDVEINQEEATITPDKECIDAVWSVIQQHCEGDIDKLMQYLSLEYHIEQPTNNDIVTYVMELVDEYLNNSITINQGEQYVRHGKMGGFFNALLELDYKIVVEELLRKLHKNVGSPSEPPLYIDDLIKITDEYLARK